MYSFNSRVRYSEVDERGVMSITSIMKYMTDCAMFDSINIDYDLDRLGADNLGWYITQWQVRINKNPLVGQDIVITTWAYKFKGMLGFRNFAIDTPAGERLVEADSTWVLMNLASARPVRVPEDMSSRFISTSGVDGKWLDSKIVLCDELSDKKTRGECDYTFTVGQMHIDTNHHMNNARYIEAVTECTDSGRDITYMRANYKQVALKGDIVKVASAGIDGGIQALLYNDETDYANIEMYYD